MKVKKNSVWVIFWLATILILSVFSKYICILTVGFELYLSAFLAILGTFLCIKKFSKEKKYTFLNFYVSFFFLCILVSYIYTILNGYNDFTGATKYLSYYMIVFLIYPIIHLSNRYDCFIDMVKALCLIVIILMIIKGINCILYDATGIILFEGLIRTARNGHTNAAFNGIEPLVPLFEFYIFLNSNRRKKKRRAFVLFFISLFYIIWFIGARMLILAVLLGCVTIYMSHKKTSMKRMLSYFVLMIGIVVMVNTSYFDDMFKTIMTVFDSSYVANRSTAAIRVMEIVAVAPRLRGKLFGIGMAFYGSAYYSSIFSIGSHDDLGILGTYFFFGVLAIPMIGLLLFRMVQITYKLRNYFGHELRLGLLIYFLITCVSVSLFDANRVCLLPFLIGFYEIANIKYMQNKAEYEYSYAIEPQFRTEVGI